MNVATKYSGLSDSEVLQSREEHGANIITPPPKEPAWKLYLEKFDDPLIRILLIAAVLSFIISLFEKDFYETLGIFIAIILATFIGFWFEYDARRKFDILNLVNDEMPCRVIRNGHVTETARKNLVVGDIIILNTGEEVPADALLLESVSLRIDESSLTGEPVTYKTAHPETFTQEATYPPNEILRGSIVVDGHCSARVTRVGDQTEYGRVAREAIRETEEKIPLNQQLERLAQMIGIAGFVFALLTFLVLFIRGLAEGHYTLIQWGSSLITMISVGIAISKVWAPFIRDGFELVGRNSHLARKIEEKTWPVLLTAGAAFFIIAMTLGFVLGIDPLGRENWITLKEAEKILHHFMVAVTIIVVAVPEGLPMSVTLSLALNMRRMLRQNSLVRKMHAIETMGAVNVICTDKTGTLTMNRMEVSEFFIPAIHDEHVFEMLKAGMAVNSTAHLDMSQPGNPRPLGNPTESALLMWLWKNNIPYETLRARYREMDQLTFSTERKYMATIAEDTESGEKILFIKGAPEILLKMCSTAFTEKGKICIEESLPLFAEVLERYQSQAMRMLGFAYARLKPEDKPFKDGKIDTNKVQPIFLGVCAISDPLRADAAESVQICIDAGIEVKVITGDTRGTARETGRQIGLIDENTEEDALISGDDFESLSDEEALEAAQRLKIMYRALPTHKQRLVKLLQNLGYIVAVTGDGTNDAAALNQAHVGLSMGSGAAVAREASDITIIDDSFRSIANAIMWGRSLYRNIQRFIIFQLTINVAALLLVFIGSVAGHEVPLTVTQMLWVNLIMDTFAAAALSTLPAQPEVMKEKPRRNEDFIVSQEMKRWILGAGILFTIVSLVLYLFFNSRGPGISVKELTIVFTTFVMLQFWNLFNVKVFGTNESAFSGILSHTGFVIVVVAILYGQWMIVEWGGEMFRTTRLSIGEWLLITGGTAPVLLAGEIIRFRRRSKAQ